MSDVVEHTDVVCPPKRTLAEQAEEGRVLPPVNFFRLSEARLRNSPVFRQISARPLAKRGVRVVGTPQHLTKSLIFVLFALYRAFSFFSAKANLSPEICLADILARRQFPCAARKRDASRFKDIGAVRDGECHVGVLFHEEDGCAHSVDVHND